MKNDMYDKAYTEKCYEENLRFIKEEYLRAEVHGKENIPFKEAENRPVIFVANHSGMTLSWDNIIFDYCLYEALKEYYNNDMEKVLDRKLRRLIAPKLVHGDKNLSLFAIPNWWKRLGCVEVSMESFEALAQKGGFIFNSPEGVPGIGKGFDKRYQLQRFSSSFIYIARKYNALVVPVSIVNAEYFLPFNYSTESVSKFAREKMQMPFFPIGITSAIKCLFPATFVTPYPAKVIYKIHEPIAFESLGDRTKEDLREEAETFRKMHQNLLDDSVKKYHKPYDMAGLIKAFIKSDQKRMFLPFFWHDMFHKTADIPKGLTFAHKIPLGYPLVTLFANQAERTYVKTQPRVSEA